MELATHLEWGVALDILCDQIYEYKIGISIDLKLLQSLVIQDGN